MIARTISAAVLTSLVIVAGAIGPAAAQDPGQAETFFAGKTLTVVVGYPPGGGFDLYSRILAQHLGAHIPGKPAMVVQNMPGASSFKAANYIYNVAAKDGTYIGAIDSNAPLAQRMTGTGRFEPEKFFWIGRLAADDSVGLTWHTSGVATVEDAKKKEVHIAAGTPMGPAAMVPAALNNLVGTKFNIILGYRGSAPMVAAMEQGETGGAGTFGFSALATGKPHWLRDNLVNILYVVGYDRHPALPHVPALVELADNETDRNVLRLVASRSVIGRSYNTPPGIPNDRGTALRTAFDTMVADKDFLADMKKRNISIDPATGDEIATIVANVMKADDKVIERTKWATTP